MQDSNLIKNLNIHCYPTTVGMTSQDLFILLLTTKTLHLIMKCFYFFLFFPHNFLPTILSEQQNFCFEVEIVITPDLAVHDNKETAEKK